jgi:hypothetical protein
LIPYAEAVDGGENFIEYKVKDTDRTFTNGSTPGQYKSRELALLDPAMVGDKTINEMKDIFGAEVKSSHSIADMPDDLEPVYSDDKSPEGLKFKAQIEKNKATLKALKAMK